MFSSCDDRVHQISPREEASTCHHCALATAIIMPSLALRSACTGNLHNIILPAFARRCTSQNYEEAREARDSVHRLSDSPLAFSRAFPPCIAYVPASPCVLSAPWYSRSTASSSAVAVGRTAAARDRHGLSTGRRRDCRHAGGCSASGSSHGNRALPSMCRHTSSEVRRTTWPTMASNATTPASHVGSHIYAYSNTEWCRDCTESTVLVHADTPEHRVCQRPQSAHLETICPVQHSPQRGTCRARP